jgi:hypothetical protein
LTSSLRVSCKTFGGDMSIFVTTTNTGTLKGEKIFLHHLTKTFLPNSFFSTNRTEQIFLYQSQHR